MQNTETQNTTNEINETLNAVETSTNLVGPTGYKETPSPALGKSNVQVTTWYGTTGSPRFKFPEITLPVGKVDQGVFDPVTGLMCLTHSGLIRLGKHKKTSPVEITEIENAELATLVSDLVSNLQRGVLVHSVDYLKLPQSRMKMDDNLAYNYIMIDNGVLAVGAGHFPRMAGSPGAGGGPAINGFTWYSALAVIKAREERYNAQVTLNNSPYFVVATKLGVVVGPVVTAPAV